jgi:hypothetical protein
VAASTAGGAANCIIHADMMQENQRLGQGKTPPPATMSIKGTSLEDGSQFKGFLTEE